MKKEERIQVSFGTSGWRGVIADDFTFEHVRVVTQAISEVVKKTEHPQIVIGYDSRFMAEDFSKVIAEVLCGNEIKVFLCDMPTPTPVIAYSILNHAWDGGINVTASHNPAHYSGMKFNGKSGGPALPEITGAIEKEIDKVFHGKKSIKRERLPEASRRGLFESFDPREPYFQAIREKIDFERIRSIDLRVTMDLMYGAGNNYLDVLVKEALGERTKEELIAIHDFRDPYFGGYRPEPDSKRMEELGRRVVQKGHHLGIAVDGDADRFGVCDEDGDFVPPNEFLALVAWHLFKNKGLKGNIARSIATSHQIDKVASEYGGETIVTPVGFKFIGERIISDHLVMGGEESGGLSIQNHIPEKDGIIACLLALEMIAYEEKPLSQIRQELKKAFGTFFSSRKDLHLESNAQKMELMDFFREMPGFAGYEFTEKWTMDGYGYLLQTEDSNSWVLARSSGTEPLVRIYLESTSKEIFDKMNTEVDRII